MDNLIKELDDSLSDTSIIDVSFDDEEMEIQQNELQFPIQQEIIEEQSQIEEKEIQNLHLQKEYDENKKEPEIIPITKQFHPIYFDIKKTKKSRQCDLQQAYGIAKTLGCNVSKTIQYISTKKNQIISKYFIMMKNGVQKLKQL